METRRPSPSKQYRCLLSKYLTYKEWKLVLPHILNQISYVSVSTLPIRNGNFLRQFRFPPHSYVSTLPIRNGNCGLDNASHTRFNVSTLPIRNGNIKAAAIRPSFIVCKYLTYKEWKRILAMFSWFRLGVSTLPIRNGNVILLKNYFGTE